MKARALIRDITVYDPSLSKTAHSLLSLTLPRVALSHNLPRKEAFRTLPVLLLVPVELSVARDFVEERSLKTDEDLE